jgi:hypothetical protein
MEDTRGKVTLDDQRRKGCVCVCVCVCVCAWDASLCASSLLLHGPSHVGTMTDLISHFATDPQTCGCGPSSREGSTDSQARRAPAIKAELCQAN